MLCTKHMHVVFIFIFSKTQYKCILSSYICTCYICVYVCTHVFKRCCQGSPGFMRCVAPNILSAFWYLLCPWGGQWRGWDCRFWYVAALAMSQDSKNSSWRIVSFGNSFSDFWTLVYYLHIHTYVSFILEFYLNHFNSFSPWSHLLQNYCSVLPIRECLLCDIVATSC